MKKILILFVVLFSLISVERLHTVEDTEQICELLKSSSVSSLFWMSFR